ncbi:MAG: 4-(cytidine 5'-diphospho)-2-C-methyl-D-erythritol kinase [Campylobacter sp.]
MKSFAKINVFLKIIGTRGNYHEILSRFALVKTLYDEIEFESSNRFCIECNNDKITDNIILKAIEILNKAGFKDRLDDFFKTHKIVIKKNIPIGAGLGGGSSNAATFLKMVNSELKFGLSRENLTVLASKIGADVAFFVSGFKTANVSGIGEIVREFDDDMPDVEILTPDIFCSTSAVYNEFRANFMQNIDKNLANKMLNLSSRKLLENYTNSVLNDLYAPCFKIYTPMHKYANMYLSGSGSSVFKVRD